MTLARIAQAEELLDQPGHEPGELARSLEHVAQVNRFLGGNRSVLRAVRRAIPDGGTVLDVGTGSADLPRALVRWSRRAGVPMRVAATDVHPQTLAIARAACASYKEITVEPADALALPYANGQFDVALLCLTLHHFSDAEQRTVLGELARVARKAIIVSELERGWMNYLGARLLAATWWRRNAITRHDGPLSVLRAFTATELARIASNAGFHAFTVRRHFFFRLILQIDVDSQRDV